MSKAFEKIRNTDLEQLRARWSKLATCIDMHTGGEPLRVVIDGTPPLTGTTILAKRRQMIEQFDSFRKLLMWEPRGHADMYGCLLLPPERPDSDFGVLFMHNEGYSTMCGHGIIGLVKVGLDCGLLELPEGRDEVRIDSPAGRVTARPTVVDGRVREVAFENVPSFVLAPDQRVDVPGLGEVRYDLAYGGAFYAYVTKVK